MITETIIERVSLKTGLSKKAIKSKSRKKELVMARNVCMYLMKKHTILSLATIGATFGKRDHSTVLHALKNMEDDLFKNSTVKKLVYECDFYFKSNTEKCNVVCLQKVAPL